MSTTTKTITTLPKNNRRNPRRRRRPQRSNSRTRQVIKEVKKVTPKRRKFKRRPPKLFNRSISSYSSYSGRDALTLQYKTRTPFHDLFLEYAAAILSPESVTKGLGTIRIPDLMMLPCTVQQSKTTFQLSPDSNGSFVLWLYPYMKAGFNIATTDVSDPTAAVMINGTILPGDTDATFDIWQYAQFYAICTSYRIISSCCSLRYTGKVLDESGRFASACLPEFNQAVNTYDELANYIYSTTTTSVEGIRQVWLPSDYQSFEMLTPDSEPGFDVIPSITIAGAGFPPSTLVEEDPVYNWCIQGEIIVNYELYGTNPLITSTSIPSTSSPKSLSNAARASSLALKKTGGGSSIKEVAAAVSKPLMQTAMDTLGDAAPQILEEAIPLILEVGSKLFI